MTPALKKFADQIEIAIDSVIQGHATTGQLSREMRIDLEEIGVVRFTMKLRNDVFRFCDRMHIPVEFVRNTRSFHFTIKLNKVLLTAAQAEATKAANLKFQEVA